MKFPTSPQAPDEFFERTLPALVRARGGVRGEKRSVRLGVRIEGEGGGEWLYTLRAGEIRVRAGSRARAHLTWIQSVEDWRGGLWGGRGGIVAERMLGLLRGGPLGRRTGRAAAGFADSNVVARLAEIDGVLRAVVRDGPEGDWSTAFKFGPGAIPAEATTTVSIRHDDAEAIARRELRPLAAFLAGRIAVDGSLSLVMQLRAAAAARPAKPSEDVSGADSREIGSER